MTANWLSRRRITFLAVLIIELTVARVACSQSQGHDMEEFMFNSAKDFIEFEDYESAYDLLKSLDSISPNNPNYTYQIGLCF